MHPADKYAFVTCILFRCWINAGPIHDNFLSESFLAIQCCLGLLGFLEQTHTTEKTFTKTWETTTAVVESIVHSLTSLVEYSTKQ